MVTEGGANFSVMAHVVENFAKRYPKAAKGSPHPELVVEINRDGAKSGSADRRRRVDGKPRLRFGLLSGESSFIDPRAPDACGHLQCEEVRRRHAVDARAE